MQTVTVSLGKRSYPICIGSGLLRDPEMFRNLIGTARALIVTNTNVAPLYLSALQRAFDGNGAPSLVLPDGETVKSLDSMQRIITELLTLKFGRDACLVALGGGVIGDLTGFAAACYQRGIGFVQVPTTLLAQVDSAVGGKTAVNHELGKNMIGAFHQPRGVIADTDTLRTLPARELRAGLAEVIKYGLIRDATFLGWIEGSLEAVLALEPEALWHVVGRSCEIKADVVARDEREDGLRAILNFGHSFGHAIETALGYRDWLHGEAVAVGMLIAAELSAALGWLPGTETDRLRDLLLRAGLPVELPPGLAAERIMQLMAVDKKVRDGRLRLVLLRGVGNAELHAGCDEAAIAAAIDCCMPGKNRNGH